MCTLEDFLAMLNEFTVLECTDPTPSMCPRRCLERGRGHVWDLTACLAWFTGQTPGLFRHPKLWCAVANELRVHTWLTVRDETGHGLWLEPAGQLRGLHPFQDEPTMIIDAVKLLGRCWGVADVTVYRYTCAPFNLTPAQMVDWMTTNGRPVHGCRPAVVGERGSPAWLTTMLRTPCM